MIGGYMTLDEQILETIQQIGGIFQTKNITSIPVNIEYLEERVAPGMETIVVLELIMYLEDLMLEYLNEEKKVHKYARYTESFKNILFENSNDGSLIGRSKRSA
jgi:hypothetical protein